MYGRVSADIQGQQGNIPLLKDFGEVKATGVLGILWNNQQMRQCAVKFISLQVHSTCFGRHTRPSSGVEF
jgi:hypothetical protein